jgi:hypothetical protein
VTEFLETSNHQHTYYPGSLAVTPGMSKSVVSGSQPPNLVLPNMSVEHAAGVVSHHFTPAGLIACLKFASNLKASADICTALADACEVLFGPRSGMVDALRKKEYRLPSISLLRVARVRLDLMSILFQRQLFFRYTHVRYLLIDSSLQVGFNILCVREDRFAIPRDEFVCPE